ncbi:hypothetical protein L3X38_024395 [Prunus dulcis]|uniref:Uncharacterized protein n=1 Tax=Prunus dulcis TaxID=3755 RepID=A0AAD4W2G6_PRUDU|nr:hypothetical protein L3X38_024395 [Prunus dulcis]
MEIRFLTSAVLVWCSSSKSQWKISCCKVKTFDLLRFPCPKLSYFQAAKSWRFEPFCYLSFCASSAM